MIKKPLSHVVKMLSCHLHPLSKTAIVGQGVDGDYSSHIFKMIVNERMKKLVNREFFILGGFRCMLKMSNDFFNGGRSMNLCTL
jgi:hypothetical protein